MAASLEIHVILRNAKHYVDKVQGLLVWFDSRGFVGIAEADSVLIK